MKGKLNAAHTGKSPSSLRLESLCCIRNAFGSQHGFADAQSHVKGQLIRQELDLLLNELKISEQWSA